MKSTQKADFFSNTAFMDHARLHSIRLVHNTVDMNSYIAVLLCVPGQAYTDGCRGDTHTDNLSTL